jgi:subtilisin family serine protease
MRLRNRKASQGPAIEAEFESLERRDCPAAVSISGPLEVAENGQPVALMLTLSERQTKPVEVRYAVTGTATAGQDYRLSIGSLGLRSPSGSVVFKPGVTSLPITFTPLNDTVREGNETFQINLISARGHSLGQKSLTTTLADDDSYTPTLTGPTRVAASSTTRFTLQLSSPATRNETFFITTEDRSATAGADYAAVRNIPVSFVPGQQSRQFSIATGAGSVANDRSFAITVRSQAADVPAVAPLMVTIEGTGLPPAPPAGPSLPTATFTHDYGWGIVNASASVAKLLGRTTAFPEVPNLGGVSWGNDIVRAPEVWAQGYTGQGIVVAVVDTGVDYTHPSLQNSIWVNTREIPGDGFDNDNNGFVDDVRGWDFFGNDNDPMDGVGGQAGHGTHVAGTIAAAVSTYGPSGVAPHTKIMPVRLSNMIADDNYLASAISYAANNGAHVINLSLGVAPSSAVLNAITHATSLGAIVVVAAGNNALASPSFPAMLATRPGVLSVGAVDSQRAVADFSNRAGTSPALKHVVAPGVNVTSTVPAGYPGGTSSPSGTFASLPGTSMAAPHVAGVVALMLSAVPNPKALGVRDRIVNALVSTAEQPPALGTTGLAASGVQAAFASTQNGRGQTTARSLATARWLTASEEARHGQTFSGFARAVAASIEASRPATPQAQAVVESVADRRTARRGVRPV